MENPKIKEIRDGRIGGYRISDDIDEHFQAEEAVRRSYAGGGKFLLELLQNAEDAMRERENPGKVKIYVSREKIIVANEGEPFSDEGFRAICCQNISPKSSKGFIGNKGLGFKSVLNLTDSPRIYSGEFYSTWSREKTEKILKSSIEGFEKKDLPLMRLPFFSQPQGVALELINEGFDTIIELPLKKDVPFEKFFKEIETFDEKSLIFLSFIRKVTFFGLIEKEITLFRKEKEKFGFGKTVEKVQIYSNGFKRSYDVFRCQIEDKKIKPSDQNAEGNVEIAIGIPERKDENSKIYNFFPTKEFSPFPFPIHGTFLLDEGRRYFREDDLNYHQKLMEKLADFFCETCLPALIKKRSCQILELIKPQGEFLEESVTENMWQKFQGKIQNSRFIPGIGRPELFRPLDSRIHGFGLGEILEIQNQPIEEGFLLPDDWQKQEEEISVLEEYGASKLSNFGFMEALYQVIPNNYETSIKVLEIISKVISYAYYPEKEKLADLAKKIRVWWVVNRDNPISLQVNTPILLTEPNFTFPSWISFFVVDSVFFESIPPEIKEDYYLQRIIKKGILEYNDVTILKEVVLPHLKEKKEVFWKSNGFKALELLFYFTKELLKNFKETDILWADDLRANMARIVKVPVKGDSWMPAWKTYAGKEWGLNFDFEEFVLNTEDRGILLEKEIFLKKGISRDFLSFIGVSFCPKIITSENEERKNRHFDYIDNPYPESSFSRKEWRNYLTYIIEMERFSPRYYDWEIKENLAIEGFPGIVNEDNLTFFFKFLKDLIDKLGGFDRYIDFKYRGKFLFKNTSGSERELNCEPVIIWQLKTQPWVCFKEDPVLFPGETSFKLEEVFLKGKMPPILSKVLPVINFEKDFGDKNDYREMLLFCSKELSLREGFEKISIEDWEKWFKELPNAENKTNGEDFLKITRLLFGKFLDYRFEEVYIPWPLENIKVPVYNSSGGLEFVDKSNAWFLDDSKFDPVKQAIYKNSCKKLFILELQYAQNAKERLGIELCSEKISLDDPEYIVIEEKTKELQKTLKARSYALRSICDKIFGKKFKEKLDKIKITHFDEIKAVKNLRLTPIFDGECSENGYPIKQEYFFDENNQIFLVNLERDIWKNLSVGLAKFLGKGSIASYFEVIFKDEDNFAINERLRSLGITEGFENEEVDNDEIEINESNSEKGLQIEKEIPIDVKGEKEEKSFEEQKNEIEQKKEEKIETQKAENKKSEKSSEVVERTKSPEGSEDKLGNEKTEKEIIGGDIDNTTGPDTAKVIKRDEESIQFDEILNVLKNPSFSMENKKEEFSEGNYSSDTKVKGGSNNLITEKGGAISGRNESKGESEEHRKMKKAIFDNPEIIGAEEVLNKKEEHTLFPNDRVDVLIESKETVFLVEVKRGSFFECLAGLFQVEKYRALKKAHLKVAQDNRKVEALLVSSKIYPLIKRIAEILEIRTEEIKVEE